MSKTSERRIAQSESQKTPSLTMANEEALERQVRQMKAALIVKLDKKTGKKTPDYIVRVAEGKAS
ncbi:hypothetical protein [Arthrobacter sulfonylureivorans]|jgi:hypothetical protein|uniref:Uncharacterized protein n=1 Tax=Arthrobacter sulfonylureivorans TaxID=2486855 RepID=A0ABY3W8Z2_9MICC|nr:hypothetical protein [Arthrobacter sulfonylureivorans]UNK45695.1 hypothetical protein MNQ99_17545 [Arthrobacter sulfonylureivorans]